jgi:thiol:disulfide interchange protein DsbD
MLQSFQTGPKGLSQAALLAVGLIAAATVGMPDAAAHQPDGIEARPEVPESARAAGAVDDGDPRVVARLISDAEGPLQPGETFRVGVHFEIDPDWHIYWRNSGDAGMATQVGWEAPGLTFGELRWPAPHVYEQGRGEISTFGYAKEVVLQSQATVDESADGGEAVTLTAEVSYLACKIDCIPGTATLKRTLPIQETDQRTLAGKYLDTYGERVPVKPSTLGIDAEVVYSQTPIRPGDTFRTAVGLNTCAEGPGSCGSWRIVREAERWALIPDTTTQVDFTTTAVVDHPQAPAGQVIRLDSEASPNAPKDDERLSGVVHLKNDAGTRAAILVEAPIPRGESGAEIDSVTDPLLDVDGGSDASSGAGKPAATAQSTSSESPRRPIGLAQALLFALLGGLILNLMPCVFPVLALKVSAFTQLVHEDRRHVMAHGAAYTAGIVGSMLVLAGVVLGLRAVGTEVGWGFQFQNPMFPAILSGFLVLFALNLFGVFEVNVSPGQLAEATEERSGLTRSFGEGILAVVLATPCSAPFLGTAVGFALASGPLIIVTIFAALGLGLALPFVVLTLVPGWSKVLPKPGPWMDHLKHVLGFTLIGAAIWLTWIVGRSAGVDAMAQVLIFLGVVAFVAWVFGTIQFGSNQSRALGALVAAALVLGAGVPTLDIESSSRAAREAGTSAGATDAAHAGASAGSIDWSPWSDEAVQSQLDKGRPVFVDFTADWCITCKVNERTVLSTETVLSAFDNHDVATLKADWTNGDETIRKKLASFGKAGVPLYLVYSPGEPEDPRVLPEVLTPDLVASAVRDAANDS